MLWYTEVNQVLENQNHDYYGITETNQLCFRKPELFQYNMALLGDAAHPMTPDLGQGACQAIEDANVFADCFVQGKKVSESLHAYETKRLQRVKSIALKSYRIGLTRQLDNSMAIAARNSLLRILPDKFALKMLERTIRN